MNISYKDNICHSQDRVQPTAPMDSRDLHDIVTVSQKKHSGTKS